MRFIRLLEKDGSWFRFLRDWEKQCSDLGEDFEIYRISLIGVVEDLAKGEPSDDAAIYALESDEGAFHFHALCQVNVTLLPGYMGRVLRVRMIYFAPCYDFGVLDLDQYVSVLVRMFSEIMKLSDGNMVASHVKFHLRSPADRQFFAAIGSNFENKKTYASVVMRGAWLYITK